MSLPSIEQLNRASPSVFIEAVNTLFETAPPLADRLLAARPYSSYLALIDLAESVCLGSDLSEQDKLDIINAHPRIGESKTNLSAMSLKEQGYNTRQGAESEQDRQVNATLAEVNKVPKEQNEKKAHWAYTNRGYNRNMKLLMDSNSLSLSLAALDLKSSL